MAVTPKKSSEQSGAFKKRKVLTGARRAQLLVFGGLLILLSLAGLAVWQKPRVMAFAQNVSATRQMERATAAWSNGDARKAFDTALRVWDLKPNQIETLRLLLDAGGELREPRLLVVATGLMEHPQATLDDQIAVLQAVNDAGATEDFAAFYRELPSPLLASPEVRFEHLRWLTGQGKAEQVINILADMRPEDELLTNAKHGPAVGVLRWRALMQFADSIHDEEAGGIAASLLERYAGDAMASDEMESLLVDLCRLPPERFPGSIALRLLKVFEIPEVVHLVQLNGDPTVAVTLRMASQPQQREALLEQAVATFGATHTEAVCLWLERLGENRRVLDLVEAKVDELSSLTPELYSCRVRSLIAEKQDRDALAALDDPVDGVDRVDAAIVRAWVAARLDLPNEVAGSWQLAMWAAGLDSANNHYLKIAQAAKRAEQIDIAAEALVKASASQLGRFPSGENASWVIEYLMNEDRPEDLYQITKRMLAVRQHPALLNNALYLSLICTTNSEPEDSVIEVAEQLAEHSSRHPEVRNTLALYYFLAGRGNDALALYQTEEFKRKEWQEMRAAGRATLALVLSANAAIEPFNEVLAAVEWNAMSTLERHFYQGHLQAYRETEFEAQERSRNRSTESTGSFLNDAGEMPLLLPGN